MATMTLERQDSIKFSVRNFLSHKIGTDIESQYVLGKLLGEGGFGEVFQCTQKHTGEERAAKRMEKQRQQDVNDEIIREFNVLRELDHPNLLKAYDLFEGTCIVFFVFQELRHWTE
jgi:serine/threonine protein kinase